MKLRVRAIASLQMPRALRAGRTLRIRGHVHGIIPAGGVKLKLQVRQRGKWRLFDERRTDAKGTGPRGGS